MAATCAEHAVGYILTTKYDVFENCYEFCLKENIDYYSCHMDIVVNCTKFLVYLFSRVSREAAMKTLLFLKKLELEHIFVNVVDSD